MFKACKVDKAKLGRLGRYIQHIRNMNGIFQLPVISMVHAHSKSGACVICTCYIGTPPIGPASLER